MHVSCDIACDVTPHSTTDSGWDNKSLYVAYCRQVTLWDCVRPSRRLWQGAGRTGQVTPCASVAVHSECHYVQVTQCVLA